MPETETDRRLIVSDEHIANLKLESVGKPKDELTIDDYEWLHWRPEKGTSLREAIWTSLRKHID